MTQAPAVDMDDAPVEAEAETQEETDVAVQEAELEEAAPAPATGPGGQIDILLDTSVEVTASLGTVRMPVRELLEHGPGSVVQLDRAAGEPVDLLLNGIRFATGHLVVVGDRLGVRVKEILRPAAASEDEES